jgi:hypothetical protein
MCPNAFVVLWQPHEHDQNPSFDIGRKPSLGL